MGIVRTIKNVTNGYSSSQVKVRNVTANDEGSPSPADMQEIADLTYDKQDMFLIMDMVDKRLSGKDNVIVWCRENMYIIKTLREFQYREEATGRDLGGAIRARARDLVDLLQNPERLREEREHRGRRGGGRRPQRYHSPSGPRRPNRPGVGDNEDDEIQRALELSKETAAQEEELRRLRAGQGSQDDLQKAMSLSQQNGRDLLGGNLIDTSGGYSAGYEAGYNMYQPGFQTGYDAQAQYQSQLQAQVQAEAELQRQYDERQAQLQQLEYQNQLYQQQIAAAQAQAQAQAQAEMSAAAAATQTPLKTGSNNPFAAFNQQQQQQQQQQQAQPVTAQPTLRRHKSFSQEHTDQLEAAISREAPADTFGNTGQARIPSHHTQSYMVDSAGRGLVMQQTMTGKQTANTNNPFVQQYTGIATTQMQPAHTGYGFGNANQSSANLIDM